MKDPNRQRRLSSLNAAFIFTGLLALIAIVFACKCTYPAVAFLIALAAFASGGITGFIFGIPRTMQKSTSTEGHTEVHDNTNLEQISDWLTKIMVGVGLTQINSIKSGFYTLSEQAGIAIGGSTAAAEQNTVFAGAILLFFALDGFLICYLWTRLVLTDIQKKGIAADVDKKIFDQDEKDKVATTAVFKQLNRSSDTRDIPTDEMYAILKGASGKTISDIYIMAVNYRKNHWKSSPDCVAKTIPIFESLVLLDKKDEYPENYAQLGYALKDKSVPDYEKAIANFTKAIQKFNANKITAGLSTIYFNRALAQIHLENKFPHHPSDAAIAEQISKDIQAAKTDKLVRDMIPQTILPEWQRLNNLPTD